MFDQKQVQQFQGCRNDDLIVAARALNAMSCTPAYGEQQLFDEEFPVGGRVRGVSLFECVRCLLSVPLPLQTGHVSAHRVEHTRDEALRGLT